MMSLLVSTAAAHSLYAEYPQNLSSDSEVEIWIAYGHGGSADTQIDSLPVARMISPDHEETELELAPYEGGLKGKAALEESGCYILDLQMAASLFDPSWYGSSGSKSLVEKYGRALLPVQSGDGCNWSSHVGLEIVSETDPYLLRSGQEFKARAMWNGHPVPGSFSAVVARSPQDVLVIQHAQEAEAQGSSSDGQISFTTGRPGLWVVSFEATIDESGTWKAEEDDSQGHYRMGDELAYEQIAPTAYLTFWVLE
ncbi:MAG: DUF4198 domain-containing protein [Methanothrix sp.]